MIQDAELTRRGSTIGMVKVDDDTTRLAVAMVHGTRLYMRPVPELHAVSAVAGNGSNPVKPC